ncbi:phosphoesterase family-domain-containing protein [Globomyces pollinis-pini]|nr:phosphoesterase family-domain-containing protein [Globomyces pollinis-pini]
MMSLSFEDYLGTEMLPPIHHSRNAFDRIFIITFENTDYEDVMNDPYLGVRLRQRGRLLSDYHAVTHPSQGNYFAMISGSFEGNRRDDHVDIIRPNIVDLLIKAEKSWISYQEDYPSDAGCFEGDLRPYVRKHNPFISFPHIRKDPALCSKIVNAIQLQDDIINSNVADYVFYTPNMNNDGHDTSVQYLSNYLEGFLEPLLSNQLFSKTMFVVTFDENKAYFGMIDFKRNHIYTLLIGSNCKPNSTDSTYYDHYSLLATVEQQWELGNLGEHDEHATPFNFIIHE